MADLNKFVELKPELTSGGDPIVLRTGSAEKIAEQNGYSLSGDLDAPLDYFLKRRGQFDDSIAFVAVNVHAGHYALHLYPDYKDLAIEVTGSIRMDIYLQSFGINEDLKFTSKQLANKIKMNRRLFSSRDEAMNLVSKLMAFRAKVTKIIDDHDDQKGNRKFALETQLEKDVPDAFTLQCPLFSGGDKYTFSVDLCADVTASGVMFYMESVELAELLIEEKERMINERVDQMKDIVIIRS